MTLYRETGTLTYTAPFDFSKSLEFIGNFGPVNGEQTVEPTSLTKAIMIDGQTVAFRVSFDQGQLSYTLFSEQPLTSDIQQRAVAQISFFLSLEDDLTPFYAVAQTDPCFSQAIAEHYGMHHVKFLTLAEIACWSILTQHTYIPVARKMKDALTTAFGGSIAVDGSIYWAFPDLGTLRGVTAEIFTSVIGNERRAEYLVGVVEALSSIDEQWLRTAPYAEAESWLRQLRGIGPWSAAFILLRGLGHMDHMPLDLKPFLKILPKVYGNGVSMADLTERYGKYAGYWGVYLRATFG